MGEAGKENAVGGRERIECWLQYWLSELYIINLGNEKHNLYYVTHNSALKRRSFISENKHE